VTSDSDCSMEAAELAKNDARFKEALHRTVMSVVVDVVRSGDSDVERVLGAVADEEVAAAVFQLGDNLGTINGPA